MSNTATEPYPAVHASAGSAEDRDDVRLRVDVLTQRISDVIEAAGGWLFDRARNGWAVTVFHADADDATPLAVLGLSARPLSELTEIPWSDARPHMLAASSDVIRSDKRARTAVTVALKRPNRRVVVWGEPPAETTHRFRTYTHELGAAAIAFKTHALSSVGITAARIGTVEDFHGRLKTVHPCDADLVPVVPSSRRSLSAAPRRRSGD